ncbi:MAG: hypothetical protein AAGH40_01110 [Verrucomicrobiota bacterium]
MQILLKTIGIALFVFAGSGCATTGERRYEDSSKREYADAAKPNAFLEDLYNSLVRKEKENYLRDVYGVDKKEARDYIRLQELLGN